MRRIIIILFVVFINLLNAQKIQLQSGSFELKKIKPETFKISKRDIYQNKVHLLVQFYSIPKEEEKINMEKAGIQFLAYIPNNAYIVQVSSKFSFKKIKNIRAISSIKSLWKLSDVLVSKKYPSHAMYENNEIRLIATVYEDLSFVLAQKDIEAENIHVIQADENSKQIIIQIPINDIEKVACYSMIQFLEPIQPEPTPENYTGGTLNKITSLYNNPQLGKTINGNGIKIMVQDDGIIGPHIDYTGRIQHFVTNNLGDHGDHVSGTIIGAGNLNPLHRGMAWGADLFVYDANDNNYNVVPNLYNTNQVTITSKSYAQNCNGGYTAICNQLDKQLRDYTSLQHFFSAGNSGTSNCGYGAGANWGNITGGHKSAKNTLAIGNTDKDGALNSSSSRGPATDGRIKPDVCSKGTDVISTTSVDKSVTQYISYTGTSMSCPMASGTMAVLYQGYKELNGGQLPYNALMKGIMLNTADDYGNPGPDFKYGFGIINATRAFKVLKEKTYLIDSISQGMAKKYNVAIPTGTKQVKIMLYWNDKEAASGAKPALVNDLNLSAIDKQIDHNPLRLNPFPTVAALNTPAFEGIDSLNNVEQIVITDPGSIINIEVQGFAIPFGPQKFVLVYDFIEEGVRITYPVGNEKWKNSDQEIIRWESHDTINKFTLKYSLNNGLSWITSSSNISPKARSFSFSVPSIYTDKVLFAIEQDIYADTIDNPLSIMQIPNSINVIKNCGDSLILSWPATSFTKGYIVYKLGSKYMDSFAYVNTNRYVKICNNPFDKSYYAVASVHNDDFVGRRSLAVLVSGSTGNCSSINSDIAISRIISPSANLTRNCQGQINLNVGATIVNLSSISISNYSVGYQFDTLTPVIINKNNLNGNDSTIVNFPSVNSILNTGNYILKVWANTASDLINCNDTIVMPVEVIKESLKTLVREDFESFQFCSGASNCAGTICNLINGWTNETNGLRDSIDWRVYSGNTPSGFQGTGPSIDARPGTSTGKYIYIESSSCSNRFASLISPCIQLDSMINPTLMFKYHMYGNNINKLNVDLFNGTTWINDIMPEISGNKGNQWLQATVNLSAYTGIINIRIRGYTGTGNLGDIALDDINIFSNTQVKSMIDVNAPYCKDRIIEFKNVSKNSINHQWFFGADAIPATSTAHEKVDVSYTVSGMKNIKLIASNPVSTDTFSFNIFVEEKPTPIFDYTIADKTVTFTNKSKFANSYFWYFGDGKTSSMTNPQNTYNLPGQYYVSLEIAGNCGEDSIAKFVDLENSNINLIQSNHQINILPNPANEEIKIVEYINNKGKLYCKIISLDGKIVVEKQNYDGSNISISHLSSGKYIVQLQDETNKYQSTFIKE